MLLLALVYVGALDVEAAHVFLAVDGWILKEVLDLYILPLRRRMIPRSSRNRKLFFR